MILALAVIPVHDHGSTLRDVVRRTLAQMPRVLVVDDGSTDGGAETVADLPVRVVRLPRNEGKGAAIMEAARHADGATHLLTLDADGQHLPEDIPLLLEAVEADPGAIVIGSRDFSSPDIPASSRFGRAFSGFWMKVQTGVGVSDMQSGFRCYPIEVFSCLHLRERRFSFEIEVLVRAAWAGFPLREVPVRVHYPERGTRISHFRAIEDNLRITWLNTRLTCRAMTPIPFRQHDGPAVSLRRPRGMLRAFAAEGADPALLGRSAAVAVTLITLPLPGLQCILLLLAIGRFRLYRLCALSLAPLAWFPVVPGLCVLLGYRLRHGAWLTEFSLRTLGHEAGQRVLEWVIGSCVAAPILGLSAGLFMVLCAHVAGIRAGTP
ncbi:MAG: glycosyltransferase family 2 protein [Desulfovibrio sp.]|jgi:hypothetical protein|nr:glycosyltransferase family 2 protein [Desulfovibrio sp.]